LGKTTGFFLFLIYLKLFINLPLEPLPRWTLQHQRRSKVNQLGFLLPARADDLAPLALEQLAEFEDGWRQTILRFEMGERSLGGDVAEM
jgi:hypothetical protein